MSKRARPAAGLLWLGGFAALFAVLCTAALSTGAARAATKSTTPEGPKKIAGKARDFRLPAVKLINEQIRQGWEASGLQPSPAASDGEWCRRVYLDVLGRIPTHGEVSQYLADTSADKKLNLVNRLLGDEYADDYARNWTTLWSNILVGRAPGDPDDENRMINREGMQQSLRRALLRNTPYDRFVHEVVSAKGFNRPGDENFNGLVNFLADKLEDNGVQATAKTSQIFLGLQVQCTQCHNHPFNEWKQNQFWEMNAFFRQTRTLRRYEGGRYIAAVELANEDFAGENSNPDEAALFYELKNGELKSAYPVFVDGTRLKSDSGYLDQVDRRSELAKLVVGSPYLGRAIVNRMWAHFFGYGFTKPFDDLGPHNPPSHPELLEGVAGELRKNSYNIKELIRWIVLSEPYGLSSKFGKNRKDDPALGEKPMFSRFYLRQMRAEELYESLLVATEAHKARGSYEAQEASKRAWLKQFVIAFGTDENDETTTFNGTIPQTLMMMNGELVNQATKIDKGSFLYRIAADPKMGNADKIQYLYMAALARKPTSNETALANQLLALRKGDAAAALQDMWWALLNTNEFILNH